MLLCMHRFKCAANHVDIVWSQTAAERRGGLSDQHLLTNAALLSGGHKQLMTTDFSRERSASVLQQSHPAVSHKETNAIFKVNDKTIIRNRSLH